MANPVEKTPGSRKLSTASKSEKKGVLKKKKTTQTPKLKMTPPHRSKKTPLRFKNTPLGLKKAPLGLNPSSMVQLQPQNNDATAGATTMIMNKKLTNTIAH